MVLEFLKILAILVLVSYKTVSYIKNMYNPGITRVDTSNPVRPVWLSQSPIFSSPLEHCYGVWWWFVPDFFAQIFPFLGGGEGIFGIFQDLRRSLGFSLRLCEFCKHCRDFQRDF